MRHLSPLILVVACMMLASVAEAQSGYRFSDSVIYPGCWPTREAVCASRGMYYQAGVGCRKSGEPNLTTGGCSLSCGSTTLIRNYVSGQCETPVQCEGGTVTNENTCQCPEGQVNNGGVCGPEEVDEPCDSNDEAAARAAVADANSIPPTVSNATAGAGYNTINESTNVGYGCNNTCLVKTTITVRLGQVTGNQYQIIDQTRMEFVGGSCDNPPAGSTETRAVNIGYGGSGTGCAPGYSYGSVNGKIGCQYHGTTNGGTPAQSTTTTTSSSTSTTSGGGGSGGGEGTTTTTTGTSTSTTTHSGGIFNQGTNGSGIGCDPTSADYFACQGMGDFQGEETDYSGVFDHSEIDGKIEQIQNEIADSFDQMRSQFGNTLSISAGSSLPTYTGNFRGTTLTMDVSRYSGSLSIIAGAIVFISLVIAAYIILGRR